MSEIIKDEAVDAEFMAAIDQMPRVRAYAGNRVKATVVAVNKTEAVVDIGIKQSGYIPAEELSANPNLTPEDVVKVGDVIDCIVTKVNDADGFVYLYIQMLVSQHIGYLHIQLKIGCSLRKKRNFSTYVQFFRFFHRRNHNGFAICLSNKTVNLGMTFLAKDDNSAIGIFVIGLGYKSLKPKHYRTGFVNYSYSKSFRIGVG